MSSNSRCHQIQMPSNAKCHQTTDDIKLGMPSDSRCLQTLNAIKCQRSSNSRYHQTPDAIKLQITSNLECHQTPHAIKLFMPSKARCHHTRDVSRLYMSLNSNDHQTPDAIRLQMPSNSARHRTPDVIKLQRSSSSLNSKCRHTPPCQLNHQTQLHYLQTLANSSCCQNLERYWRKYTYSFCVWYVVCLAYFNFISAIIFHASAIIVKSIYVNDFIITLLEEKKIKIFLTIWPFGFNCYYKFTWLIISFYTNRNFYC